MEVYVEIKEEISEVDLEEVGLTVVAFWSIHCYGPKRATCNHPPKICPFSIWSEDMIKRKRRIAGIVIRDSGIA